MHSSILLSYKSHYGVDELRSFRTSSVNSEDITISLDDDFTWPEHVEAFLRFLTKCGYIISEHNIEKITEVCENCIEYPLSKELRDTCDKAI
jgi:hypothetical protein